MKPIQVGLLGIGTVGSGVFNVLQRNQEEIRRRAGRGIEIAMVADLDTERARAVVGNQAQVVADARQVIANPAIDVVVELIGGYGIAKQLVLEAIAAGKHVVTANKALLAVHGTEIFAAASAKGVMVAFEAAVAKADGEAALEAWRERANARLAAGQRHLEEGMMGRAALYEPIDNRRFHEDGRGYDAHEVEKAMLLDPNARLASTGYFEA